jgi:hypothetical protein
MLGTVNLISYIVTYLRMMAMQMLVTLMATSCSTIHIGVRTYFIKLISNKNVKIAFLHVTVVI